MATRNLQTNHRAIDKVGQQIFQFTSRELEASYREALIEIRAEITRLYELFMEAGELTNAQKSRFIRVSGIEQEIVRIMSPYIESNTEILKNSSMVTFDQSFYRHAWAIDQAAGVELGWGMISDTAVRAACGIGGDLADLTGFMSEKEVARHKRVMDDAFTNYSNDSRRWIERDIRRGIIKGDSAADLTKRLRTSGLMHSQNSAELIARTETLRSNGIGAQISYDQSRDKGVNVIETWDATLDGSTRPEHAEADGRIKDNETGMFSVPWGEVPGPRRSGIASQDIQCRCDSNPSIEGYSPQVRRIRGEGIQPYINFRDWAVKNGITANRFGQQYSWVE